MVTKLLLLLLSLLFKNEKEIDYNFQFSFVFTKCLCVKTLIEDLVDEIYPDIEEFVLNEFRLRFSSRHW